MANLATATLPSFYITIVTAKGSTTKKIEGDILTVGRSPECNLSIAHESMSRLHLSVLYKGGECWVEDHGSTHGTYIEGARLVAHVPTRVRAEDQIVLAQSGVKLYVSTEAVFRRESQPPLPEESAEQASKTVLTSVAQNRIEAREAALPEVRKPNEVKQKAETLVLDAYKKSAHLVHEAEIEAERRVEEIYKRAQEAQSKAEATYQKQLNEAYRAAEAAFQSAHGEAQEILTNARDRANKTREDLQNYVLEMRTSTERECETLLAEAQATARELKAGRLAEAEEQIQRKENDILQRAQTQMNERLAAFEQDLYSEAQRRRDQVETELNFITKTIEQLRLETAQLEQQKAHSTLLRREIEQSQLSMVSMSGELGKLREEVLQVEKKKLAAKEQLTLIQGQLRASEDQLQKVQNESQNQLLNLRAKFEEDKGKWIKGEQTRLEELKLETARKIQTLEREMLEELEIKKSRLGAEVALAVETALKEAPKGQGPDLKLLQNQVTELLNDQLVVLSKDKSSEEKKVSLIKLKRREKLLSYATGALVGAALLLGVDRVYNLNLTVSPIQKKIASALEQQKQELEARKFRPQMTVGYKGTYVDNVIYTDKFIEVYSSDDFQDALLAEVAPYLLKTWRIEEDKTIQLLAMNSALVKTLAEKRESIHPDFIYPSIEKMRAIEKESQTKAANLLGSQVRLESFKKVESQFFNRYLHK